VGGPRIFVGLGTNLGDRLLNLAEATRRLGQRPGLAVVARGPVVETPALLPPGERFGQPPYLNSALELASSLSPGAVLEALLAVEAEMGRRRSTRWAPRVIDLDLLLVGGLRLQVPGLTLPHPGLATRRFVLEPLAALAPDLVHPALGKTLGALLAAAPGVVRTAR
jgi:2-amino-4-hydroxy-6-hydroxymethyldihydropteridine diphosphokinase